MDEFELISEIEKCQEELSKAFVNGTISDWESYLKISNQYLGLEQSKAIIHEVYIRLNNGDTSDESEF